jgi:hypothetical protein
VVYATARKLSNLKECETAGAKILVLDVLDPATIKAAVDKIISESGKIGKRPHVCSCIEIFTNGRRRRRRRRRFQRFLGVASNLLFIFPSCGFM